MIAPRSPSAADLSRALGLAPSAPVCRCAAGCREIIDADARLCADCAEFIVEVADAEHAASCDCLGCAAWSTATVVLGGTALVWARRAVA